MEQLLVISVAPQTLIMKISAGNFLNFCIYYLTISPVLVVPHSVESSKRVFVDDALKLVDYLRIQTRGMPTKFVGFFKLMAPYHPYLHRLQGSQSQVHLQQYDLKLMWIHRPLDKLSQFPRWSQTIREKNDVL